MSYFSRLVGGNALWRLTQTAGTVITRVVPAKPRLFTRIFKHSTSAAGTAHTLTILRALGSTTARSAAAASQAVVTVEGQMGVGANTLAANDLVVARETDGVQRLYTVSAVPSSYPGDVTMTGNFTSGIAAGDKLWNFGITTDTDPKFGQAHQTAAVAADATTTLEEPTVGVAKGHLPDEPLLLHDNNATTAGAFILTTFGHTED